MLFPNSLASGGNLESISEPYYIRIPSWKIHIFGLNEITSFWNDSNPKTYHWGLERELWIWRTVWMKYMLLCLIVSIFPPRNGRITWYKQRYGWLVSRIYLSHCIFPSGFLSAYMAVSQSSVLRCLLYSLRKYPLAHHLWFQLPSFITTAPTSLPQARWFPRASRLCLLSHRSLRTSFGWKH